MKNKQYRLSVLKHQLEAKKKRGVKTVNWKLNEEQLRFVEGPLGYRTEPYLFSIKTRRFSLETRKQSYLLRELHYASTNRKSIINRKLKKSDKKLLDSYRVPYWRFISTIYLQ